MKKYDLCVIGSGPGGYVAAILAARKGADVIVVEKDKAGGTCLNTGCIPTKTLIASAEMLGRMRNAASLGIRIEGKVEPDWQAVQKRKEDVVGRLRKGVFGLMKEAGVDFIEGTASFRDRKTLQCSGGGNGGSAIHAEKIIIATGTVPSGIDSLPESERILDSTGLLSVDRIPGRLLVLGGGYIGCEFATLFAELGSRVTVVEMMERLLPLQDSELSSFIAREMKKKKIRVITGRSLEDVRCGDSGISASAGDDKLEADLMLVSVGRRPATSGLKLEAAGVSRDEKGFIPVDEQCRTNVPGIYAIGDVTGRVQLAHMASAMAAVAAENVTGGRGFFRDDIVPGCIFTIPEIASVGLTSEQCKEKDIEVETASFPFAALGKASAGGETSGFCKIIADKETDQVLGVHIAGPHATDLISESVLGMNLEVTAEELGKAIHPHPTYGEIIMETAHALHGQCANLPGKKQN